MKSVNYYPKTCLWLLFQLLASSLLGHAVECSLVMDLVDNFASRGVHCLVLISDLDSKTELSIDTTTLSNISLSLYDTNTTRLPDLSASGKECLYNLLIFDSVDSSLQFLNRCKASTGSLDSPFLLTDAILSLLITDLSYIKT